MDKRWVLKEREDSEIIEGLSKALNVNKRISSLLTQRGVTTYEEAKKYLSSFGIMEESVEIWGTGKPRREFLWSGDMAEACVFIMENRDFIDTYSESESEIVNTHINIGTGKDISIKELAQIIKRIVGFKGGLIYDVKKPDGTNRKLTDVSKIKSMGWHHKIEIQEGIEKLYKWYLNK